MKKLIISPTYNEIQNIKNLLTDILNKTDDDTHILIIDDNSPDGTANIVKKIMENNKSRLFLIEREGKLGLASAYIKGFQWGLANDYSVISEMDADFSHNPNYLNDMFELTNTYDFVIGSRYVKGGGVVGWGLIRKIISYGGSLYSRLILGCPVKDFTGGFNIWTQNALNKIEIDSILSEGYTFQIEMKYRGWKKNLTFIEYPIIFEDRILGKSKMSKKIILEALLKVWKLRFTI